MLSIKIFATLLPYIMLLMSLSMVNSAFTMGTDGHSGYASHQICDRQSFLMFLLTDVRRLPRHSMKMMLLRLSRDKLAGNYSFENVTQNSKANRKASFKPLKLFPGLTDPPHSQQGEQGRDLCSSGDQNIAPDAMANEFVNFPFSEIEAKWQNIWEQEAAHKVVDAQPSENLAASCAHNQKPKYYILDMFPYPSANGLHVGHCKGYAGSDVVARFKRMKGFEVLHPMGWDAFGLPAEQYAMKTGKDPRITSKENIDAFRFQLKRMGFSYDWSREINTSDPSYYRWTQSIFLKLFKRNLVYKAEKPVYWCPALGTVLSNEEVIDGISERGGHPVYRKYMNQWMLKITSYADRLLEDLDLVDWPESVKEMQRNWIGKRDGVSFEVRVLPDAFPSAETYTNLETSPPSDIQGVPSTLSVFTERVSDIANFTAILMSPDSVLIKKIVSKERMGAINAFLQLEGTNDLETAFIKRYGKQNSQNLIFGVFTGAYALNPISGKQAPIIVCRHNASCREDEGSCVTGFMQTSSKVNKGREKTAQSHESLVECNFSATNSKGTSFGQPSERNREYYDLSCNDSPTTLVEKRSNDQLPGPNFCLDIALEGDLKGYGNNASMSHNVENLEIYLVSCRNSLDGMKSTEPVSNDRFTVLSKLRSLTRVTECSGYKLKDWIFSRQRYWGEPFPLAKVEGSDEIIMLPEEWLPIPLPSEYDMPRSAAFLVALTHKL